jgi:crotonobetainyl-CoA hydratase
MSYQFINVECSGQATTIALCRPEVLNAIHPPMHAELQQALDQFSRDATQRVCVLTGTGTRAFCAGSDLKYAASHRIAAADLAHAYPRSGYGGIAQRFDLSKPVIAAVNGVALGGGFEIVLACDLVIAVDDASFGLPEPLIGAVAVGGGIHRLARQIGLKPALGMILTGRPVTAQEGRTLGFVNEVVSRAGLPAAVDSAVNGILRCSAAAIEASKEAVYRGLEEPSLATAIAAQWSYERFRAWQASDDAAEGARAFAEKRTPNWCPANEPTPRSDG